MYELGIRVILIQMIVKNMFSNEKKHYPSWIFLEMGNVKKQWRLIKILDKQTNNKFIKEWDRF